MIPEDPVDAAVAAHALARGLVTPAQLEQARRRRAALAAAGQAVDLLGALGPALAPVHLEELRRVAQGPAPSSSPAATAAGEAARAPLAPRQAGGGRRGVLPVAGEQVGPYVVVRELGRGGMGAVYQAEQAGRRVALKVRLDADPRRGQRFLLEGQAAARLQHPGVVQVHELGVDAQGRQFLAMDLVEGEGLDRRLERGGPLEPGEAARIGLALARALEHAHGRGVLHRDLKPANVLLRAGDGAPLLTDFGLAKAVDGVEALTRTGEVLGTPSYMPPEQANGTPADARSDVYGLGATLYHALAGRPPFEGSSAVAVIAAVLRGKVEAPRGHRPAIPPSLEAVVLRCLARSPAGRYPTMRALGDDLQRFLAEETTEADRLARRGRRRRLAWLGPGALLVAGAAWSGVVLARSVAPASVAPAGSAASPPPAPARTETPPSPPAPPHDPVRPPPPDAGRVGGEAWIPARGLTEAPAPRWGHAMVYDARRRVVVLFGGRDATRAFDDTWCWDGRRWSLVACDPRPPARYAFGMAHDAARGRVVVLGGMAVDAGQPPDPRDGSVPGVVAFDDVWELDGERWTRAAPPRGGPGARGYHAAAHDALRGRTLLFGGRGPGDETYHDLWAWSGGAWSLLDPGTPQAPRARFLFGLAWDEALDRLLLVGGANYVAGEHWSWRQGAGWSGTSLPSLPVSPGARRQPLVMSTDRGVFLFGGSNSGYLFNDTWRLEGEEWVQQAKHLTPEQLPVPRKAQAGAWDAARRELVVFGGLPLDYGPGLGTLTYRVPE